MPDVSWAGVMPAITTPFEDDGSVDHDFLVRHAAWLVDNGSTGIVPCESLGEGATLSFDEKRRVMAAVVEAVAGRVPVIPGIASASTGDAVALAQAAKDVGCRGLMVLPPYVHKGRWFECRQHFSALLKATELPCMLYNNPIAYGFDATPEAIVELASDHANLEAVKESSGDVRRLTALKALAGDRLSLFVGLDDIIVEGVAAGARGWIAGLVNALPVESVTLFDHAVAGRVAEAFELYKWFLPLLRMDTVPEFVQLIKLVQQQVSMGSERVRSPRSPVAGAARQAAMRIIEEALATNPLRT